MIPVGKGNHCSLIVDVIQSEVWVFRVLFNNSQWFFDDVHDIIGNWAYHRPQVHHVGRPHIATRDD